MSYKIIFAGTPDFAAIALKALLHSDHDVCAVYTQPDRPAGRGRKLDSSPVKKLALDHDIPVEQPLNFDSPESLDILAAYQADIMIVAAYGIILPKSVLDLPKFACLNIHASLLPKWRGAAPIQRAILNGDQTTGITIMEMAEGLDTGDMLLKKELPIGNEETGGSLHDKLAELGAEAIIECLADFDNLFTNKEAQVETLSTYAKKLSKQEGRIDWCADSETILAMIRAFDPWPASSTEINGQNMKVLSAELAQNKPTGLKAGTIINNKKVIEVSTGNGSIIIQKLQLAGGKKLSSVDVLNAKQDLFSVNEIFS